MPDDRPCAQPSIPFVSNLTGTWITEAQATDPAYWVSHLRNTVQFAAGMQTLLNPAERLFLEVGPGRTLAGLARQQTTKTAYAFTSMRHPREEGSDVEVLLQAIGRLWVSGAAVDWPALHGTGRAGEWSCRPIRSSASATGSTR